MTALIPARPVARWPWVRDFTLVGAASGILAPAVFIRWWSYLSLAGLGGALGGALLGLASARLFASRGRTLRKLTLVPLGLLAGALWGALAGLATGLLDRKSLELSVPVAAIAGALQLSWLWPIYAARRVNGRATWPVVVLASLLPPALGWGAVLLLLGWR